MVQKPKFVIVTGLSGAGKTQTLRCFEDLGYYCVDNLPAQLIATFAELILQSESPRNRIAVCVDARAGAELLTLPASVDRLRELGIKPDVLFLESSESILKQRYSESRRRHPASPTGGIEEGIRKERELLGPIRDRADVVIDTSSISAQQLREQITTMFAGEGDGQTLTITILSFGFKHGVPHEADMVLDLRFLPNPYYVNGLRALTGQDAAVRDYVLKHVAAREFLERLMEFLDFLIPRYAAEPKSYFTLALGCTGGQHRSIVIASEVHDRLRERSYDVRVRHRDMPRP